MHRIVCILHGLAEEVIELSFIGHVSIATARDSYGIENRYDVLSWGEESKLDILRRRS
jgi:hypothetical protein